MESADWETYFTTASASSVQLLQSTPIRSPTVDVLASVPRPPFLLWSPASTTTSTSREDGCGCSVDCRGHREQQSIDSGISIGVEDGAVDGGIGHISAFSVPAKTLAQFIPSAIAFSVQRLLHGTTSVDDNQPLDLSVTTVERSKEDEATAVTFTPPIHKQVPSSTPPPRPLVHACDHCGKTYTSKTSLRQDFLLIN